MIKLILYIINIHVHIIGTDVSLACNQLLRTVVLLRHVCVWCFLFYWNYLPLVKLILKLKKDILFVTYFNSMKLKVRAIINSKITNEIHSASPKMGYLKIWNSNPLKIAKIWHTNPKPNQSLYQTVQINP